MFNVGAWEWLILMVICLLPLVAGAAVVALLVLLARSKPPAARKSPEELAAPSVPLQDTLAAFRWQHEPANWRLGDALEIRTDPDTDYWQRTHYGFRRDNGHFFYAEITGDFTIGARFTVAPTAQYDQCGLMCRVDEDTWMKCAAEYETSSLSRLGSVVTNLGYSDWATQDVPSTLNAMRYKLDRRGSDFRLSWSTGRDWQQMRIFHLHNCPETLQVGVCACSPTGPGFDCQVRDLTIGPNEWTSHA
jgi:regulation of enolase protein 1 (concanavalin A-like superfamily)